MSDEEEVTFHIPGMDQCKAQLTFHFMLLHNKR